jgi:DNA-binding PadR family transcriptional regulator
MNKMKEWFSLPGDGKIVLFDEIGKGNEMLFLYGENVEREHSYLTFINRGLEKNELCLYAFPKEKAKISFQNTFKGSVEKGQLHLLDIEEKLIEEKGGRKEYISTCISRIDTKLNEMCSLIEDRKYSTLRVLIDYGSIATPGGIDKIIDLERKMLERKISFTAINSFRISSLDYDSVKELMKIHKKVVMSTKNENTAMLPGFWSIQKSKKTPGVISQETLENFVKSSLETIVLSILHKKPMSGFHIIKTIHGCFHVSLSHGTVYPLLHSLKEGGILNVELGEDMKSRIYTPTEGGEKIIEKKLSDAAKTHEHLLSLIEGEIIE